MGWDERQSISMKRGKDREWESMRWEDYGNDRAYETRRYKMCMGRDEIRVDEMRRWD